MLGPLHGAARMLRHVRGTDVPAAPVKCRDDLQEPVVALTFDDGPSEWTEPILDLLRDAGARATFFVIGEGIPEHANVLHRIRAEGHEVGNHTMSHPRLDSINRRAIAREIGEASEAIERVLGEPPAVFRPPGFHYNVPVLEVARAAGFDRVVLASATTDDYLRESAGEIAAAIVPRLAPGAIIGLHDGRPPREPPAHAGGTRADRRPTVAAVGLLLDRLPEYSFVTVSELLAL
ncbi:MAG: polysaccharide deacetylase family protein [Gaiellaceae bacterium]